MPRHVFVGGTGRSGTSITAKLLGSAERYTCIPHEVRFHVRMEGPLDLVTGHSTTELVTEMLLDIAYRRPHTFDADKSVGLHSIYPDRVEYERRVDQFQDEARTQPGGAVRNLLWDIMGRYVVQPAQSAVEHSPQNARYIDLLRRVVPHSVHVLAIRDGRDVAASVIRQPWGPSEYPEALRWWGWEMRTAHLASMQTAPFVVQFEQLVRDDGGEALQGLIDALGVDERDAERMRAFQATRITEEHAHIGAWRDVVGEDQLDQVTQMYCGVLRSLRDDGVVLPVMDRELQLDTDASAQGAVAQRQYEVEATADEQSARLGRAYVRLGGRV